MRIVILVACLWLVTSSLQAKIVFNSNRDGNWEIYTMDSDGTNQTRLTFELGENRFPVWSPNGHQIAFENGRIREVDLFCDGCRWQQSTAINTYTQLNKGTNDAYPFL